jgi:DNA-binding MarR family transcriptional regulator
MPQHEPLGLMIAAARRRIKQLVGALARQHGLSPQQFWIMVGVYENEGSALVEVASRHPIDQPTASRIVSALMKRRLVRVTVDPTDRRRSKLTLTPAGRSLAERLHPLASEVRGVVNDALTPAEREAFVASLRKIMAAVDDVAERKLAGDLAQAGAAGSR